MVHSLIPMPIGILRISIFGRMVLTNSGKIKAFVFYRFGLLLPSGICTKKYLWSLWNGWTSLQFVCLMVYRGMYTRIKRPIWLCRWGPWIIYLKNMNLRCISCLIMIWNGKRPNRIIWVLIFLSSNLGCPVHWKYTRKWERTRWFKKRWRHRQVPIMWR